MILTILKKIYRVFNIFEIFLKRITLEKRSNFVLFFANTETRPGSVYGGCVKLFHLRDSFDIDNSRFNILYLVSSCLPVNPLFWIRKVKSRGIKTILNQNGVGYPAWAGKNYCKVNNELKKIIHACDGVLYQSKFCKRSADKYLGVFNGPYKIVYNCVDDNLFKPENTKKDKDLILLVMGSHHFRERVVLPIMVLSKLLESGVKSKLIIGGRLLWPDAKNDVKKLVNKLNLGSSVVVMGSYTQEEAVVLYNKAHILIHLQYNDASPTVPIEAMSCGVPVICSDSGGLPEIVKDGCGELIRVRHSYQKMYYPSVNSIVKSIRIIMKSYSRYCDNCRKTVLSEFCKDKWIKEHEEFFDKL